ncbi:MAG: FtsW/RodA/SpoVE family cell cycle protein, partial [Rhodospirillales bacterium]|nr:FtsW/RodA/SpoVE family cell cycle protein [Rhodospirillales bacterium]
MGIRQHNAFGSRLNRGDMLLREKFWQIRWSFILLLAMPASLGFLMLYSAANGSFDPWASRQMVRFAVGLAVMLAVAMVDIRTWMSYAYTLYVVASVLLVMVEFHGSIGMGAQRWIDFGFIQIQPSEIMKIALVLALARYFHGASLQDVGRPLFLLPAIVMVFAPAILVLKQPDLGTAMMLVMGSAATFFLAGV